MIFALAATLASVQFPGGDLSELAKSFAENTQKNVVIMAGSRESAPSFTYEPSDPNDLSRATWNAAKLRQVPGLDLVFHRGRLGTWLIPIEMLPTLLNQDEEWTVGGELPHLLKPGVISVRTGKGNAISMQKLGSFLPKPLYLHWSFERYAFKAHVTDQPVKEFAFYLAKGVGGRFLERKDRFLIELDPGEFQHRALKTFDEAMRNPDYAKKPEGDRLGLELVRAAVSSATANQIGEAFATPESSTLIPIGGALRPLIERRLRSAAAEPARPAAAPAGGGGSPPAQEIRAAPREAEFLSRIDRRIIGFVRLDAHFQVRIHLQTVDVQGRPGPLIALP